MNTKLIEAKEKFKEKGYCEFSLMDFDEEFYTFIKNYLYCNDVDNLKEIFEKFRFDSDSLNYVQIKNIGFEESNKERIKLYEESNQPSVDQMWFWNNQFTDIESYLFKKRNLKISNLREYLINKIENICYFFYNVDNQFNFDELSFTLYNENCRFYQHMDGVGVNYCSMIIYLNENYKEEYGGLLLLNEEKIVPELGKVALMDLSTHNTLHGVSEVKSGPGRFAILSFPIKLK